MAKTKIMIIGVMVGFILFLLIPVFEIDTTKLIPNKIDSVRYWHNMYNIEHLDKLKEHTKVLKLRLQNLDMKEHCSYYANNPIEIKDE
jgi:hypothetical protein